MAFDEVTDFDLQQLQAFMANGDLLAPGGTEGGPTYAIEAAPPGLTGGEVYIQHLGEDLTDKYLAASTWEDMNLPSEVLDGIYEMGFVRPSKIQEWAVPAACQKRNIVGQAKNGSGKTAAFALAMLCRCDSQWPCLSGLCICPTRELAMQNYEVITKLGSRTSFTTCVAVPQMQLPRKIEAQIVVGTPGKLQDLLKRRAIDGSWCKILVIDEADTMFQESMEAQVMQIRHFLPEELQVVLFSATWPDHVHQFADKLTHGDAMHITVKKEELALTTVTQTFVPVENPGMKYSKLTDVYGALTVGQSIIFANTRRQAFDLAKRMKSDGHTVSLICGTQKSGPEWIDETERDRIMAEFRSGTTKVLVATDVLARGIDVPAVTLVVNYDLPCIFSRDASDKGRVDVDTYLHRIGRTGRFGLLGLAVSLTTPADTERLDQIRRQLQCSIVELSGDCEQMEEILKKLRS